MQKRTCKEYNQNLVNCTAGAKIIAKCPKSATSYLADGAYDTKQCREAIAKKGARALIPPRKNGRCAAGYGREKPSDQ